MSRSSIGRGVLVLLAIAGALAVSIPAGAKAIARSTQEKRVERGKRLVWSIGCNDCHTPKKLGAKGPELDTERLLSGHRQGVTMPPAPPLPPGPWRIVVGAELTAWSGPWGTTYAQNLTPDVHTGLGIWTEEMFLKALRTGKHMGVSRQIMPPMPWDVYGRLPDEDLKSIYAYLRSIPPVRNLVPDPVIVGGL